MTTETTDNYDGSDARIEERSLNEMDFMPPGTGCAMWLCRIRTEELIDRYLGLGFSFRAR